MPFLFNCTFYFRYSTVWIAYTEFGLDPNNSVIKRLWCTVMILSLRTSRSEQTVQTQIRLLLEEQSDQGLHCLLFHLHLLDKIS